MIKQYGLAGFERKYPHALSGGMQKRAALAQTLALNPEVLLLDEPFAALDAQTRVVIENDVVKICRAGRRSMVIVTHDIAEAISMADRVVMLSRRPATVKEVFEIPFSRRRQRASPMFRPCRSLRTTSNAFGMRSTSASPGWERPHEAVAPI